MITYIDAFWLGAIGGFIVGFALCGAIVWVTSWPKPNGTTSYRGRK
jgi:hypothetical protein